MDGGIRKGVGTLGRGARRRRKRDLRRKIDSKIWVGLLLYIK
jgi:hypothetical protein